MSRFSAISFLKSVFRAEELEPFKAEVAFVGRSNVGKSSLLNAICGKTNLARTSQTPGRTRTINVFHVHSNRCLVDLPGYGFAQGPQKQNAQFPKMIQSYLRSRENLRLVVVLMDAAIGMTDLDEGMILWLNEQRLPFCLVANKCDKIDIAQQKKMGEELSLKLGVSALEILWVSAKKGFRISMLANKVADVLEI